MKVISYNLNKHKAFGELDALIEATGADILCLQEAVSEGLPGEISGLQLVDATARNRLGLAVYLRRNTFTVGGSLPLTARPRASMTRASSPPDATSQEIPSSASTR